MIAKRPRPSASSFSTIARPPSGAGRPSNSAGVDEHLALRVLDVRDALVDLAVRRPHDLADREVERRREVEVALVVRGHGHDRARPVVGEHVVGDVHGQPLAVHGVDRVQAGEDAGLLGRRRALRGLLRGGATNVVADVVRVDSRDELVLGREHEERRAVQRVRPRREDGDVLVELLDAEEDLRALRTADPVALAGLDRLGPVDRVEVVEQRLRVVGDAEEPLLHEARLDLARRSARSGRRQHLLVREHRLVVGAPLDRCGLPVGEPALVELQELPLLPAVVLGLVRRERARPVVRPADPAHRARDVRDVALRGLPRDGTPSRIAAFSAGSPNESNPCGWRTRMPLRARKRVTTSPIVYTSMWPTCSVPEGYGSISRT